MYAYNKEKTEEVGASLPFFSEILSDGIVLIPIRSEALSGMTLPPLGRGHSEVFSEDGEEVL